MSKIKNWVKVQRTGKRKNNPLYRNYISYIEVLITKIKEKDGNTYWGAFRVNKRVRRPYESIWVGKSKIMATKKAIEWMRKHPRG